MPRWWDRSAARARAGRSVALPVQVAQPLAGLHPARRRSRRSSPRRWTRTARPRARRPGRHRGDLAVEDGESAVSRRGQRLLTSGSGARAASSSSRALSCRAPRRAGRSRHRRRRRWGRRRCSCPASRWRSRSPSPPRAPAPGRSACPALGADTMRNPGDSSSSALASSATGRAFSTASIISGDPAELARDGAASSRRQDELDDGGCPEPGLDVGVGVAGEPQPPGSPEDGGRQDHPPAGADDAADATQIHGLRS